MLRIEKLRCAGMKNPLGISIGNPRFSWNLVSDRRNTKQVRYRILICNDIEELYEEQSGAFYDSGVVDSDESQIYIPKLFAQSAKRYYWKVFVWDNHGQAAESREEAWFEYGLLNANDWMAFWIEPQQRPAVSNMATLFERMAGCVQEKEREWNTSLVDEEVSFPCPMLRKNFMVKGRVKNARVYVTAHGLYSLELNGMRVGDYELAPECTNYEKYLQVQTYDVTDLLWEGANAVGAVLANGWWASQIGLNGTSAQYGDKLALLMQIQVLYEDGSVECIGTDADFRSSYGALRHAELYMGEKYDANFDKKGWSLPEYDASEWKPVVMCDYGFKNLVGQNVEHMQVLRVIRDAKVYHSPKGEMMIDFKQVLAGNACMHIKGEPHATVTLAYTQETDENGNFWFASIGENNGHEDVFVLDETGEGDYHPRFSYFGFRYIRVTVSKGTLELSDILARLIGSGTEVTGRLKCSNPLVNKLQENISWTLLSNIPSILTDNPDRERAGWTGDCQMIAPTLCYNLDVQGFFDRWLKEAEMEQEMSGALPIIIPAWKDYSFMSKYLLKSPAGWGDVATILPWLLYERYGDKKVLEENYGMMKKWVAYETMRAESGNPEEVGAVTPERARHLKYLWNVDYQYGDWMVPSACYDKETREYTNGTRCLVNVIGTYYYAVSTSIVAKAAKILGVETDVAYYEGLLQKIQEAAIAELYDEEIMNSEYMGAQIFALHMGLYPKEEKEKVLGRFMELVQKRGFDAGFNSASVMWKLLSENNRADVAYDFLLNEDFPSWLYGVKQGATSVWEQMQGILPDGKRRPLSFIQPAFCSIGDWMMSGMVGISSIKPGFKKIRFKPEVTKRLEYVEGSYESVQGKIDCAWSWDACTLHVKVGVPANTTAEVVLPGAKIENTLEQGTRLEESEGITKISQQEVGILVSVGSGEYHFTYSCAE